MAFFSVSNTSNVSKESSAVAAADDSEKTESPAEDSSTSGSSYPEPSSQLKFILSAMTARPKASAGMTAMMRRVSEFRSPLEAKLTGIALDPQGRAFAEQLLDAYWSEEDRKQRLLRSGGATREVIIGSGFHAAVYAATRVRAGFPRPLVLERGDRVGGTFAMTSRPTFYLNSRNRPGLGGLAGDERASLNYLPGGLIQAANVSADEYQTNTDMAFVIRLALAQFADVVTGADVVAVTSDDGQAVVELTGGRYVTAGRVISARGLGVPVTPAETGVSDTVVTFPQFMQRMAGMWPLRGMNRVAVIGGGDSGKCVVESLLGIGPQPQMTAAALDRVDRVDWYTEYLPRTCETWTEKIRGRYQAIGRHLKPGRRLTVVPRRATPVGLPGAALVDGRTYDLAVFCAGNMRENAGLGFIPSSFGFYPNSIYPIARNNFGIPLFRVGPDANLGFNDRETRDGTATIPENNVSMFRTASKTAQLAATLPALTA